jgi:hypothetical protein
LTLAAHGMSTASPGVEHDDRVRVGVGDGLDQRVLVTGKLQAGGLVAAAAVATLGAVVVAEDDHLVRGARGGDGGVDGLGLVIGRHPAQLHAGRGGAGVDPQVEVDLLARGQRRRVGGLLQVSLPGSWEREASLRPA